MQMAMMSEFLFDFEHAKKFDITSKAFSFYLTETVHHKEIVMINRKNVVF